jgi:hypothetical protein
MTLGPPRRSYSHIHAWLGQAYKEEYQLDTHLMLLILCWYPHRYPLLQCLRKQALCSRQMEEGQAGRQAMKASSSTLF